jgi:phosphatidylethanolamine-binding protein (PEBP) family uncharacterized protein
MKHGVAVAVLVTALTLAGCGDSRPAPAADAFQLASPAFASGRRIPREYTWLGRCQSPPIEWRNAPPATHSYVLISDHLGRDTRPKVMWIAANIPDSLTALPAGAGNSPDSGGMGLPGSCYLGPGGLINRVHRYRLTLYALSAQLPPGLYMVDADTLRAAMAGMVLDSARLEFTYEQRGGFGHRWR